MIIKIDKYELRFKNCILDNEASVLHFSYKKIITKIDYIFFRHYIKESLESIMHIPDEDDNCIDIINDHFTYMEFTNNPLSRRALAIKLGYVILINDWIRNNSLLKNKIKDHKIKDELLLCLESIVYCLIKINKTNKSNIVEYDDDYDFNMLDYIFDTNID